MKIDEALWYASQFTTGRSVVAAGNSRSRLVVSGIFQLIQSARTALIQFAFVSVNTPV